MSTKCIASSFVLVPLALLSLVGCDAKPAPSTPPTPAAGAPAAKADDHDHADGDHDHDHDHAEGGMAKDHDHGPMKDLGSAADGGYTVKAFLGEVKPGSEPSVDLVIEGAAPEAVRCWIGDAEARGAIKAKAELEGDHWHTHVEVPSPVPTGARLYVEIESAAGTTVVSFALPSA
jgi:hypothetical protein